MPETPTFMISMGDNIPDSDGSTVSQLLHSLREQIAFIMFVDCLPALIIQLIPRRLAQTVWSDSRGGPRLNDSHSSQPTHFQAREFEKGISNVLVHAKYLVNSFHVTVRVPPEIITTICSHLTTEDAVTPTVNAFKTINGAATHIRRQVESRRVGST